MASCVLRKDVYQAMTMAKMIYRYQNDIKYYSTIVTNKCRKYGILGILETMDFGLLDPESLDLKWAFSVFTILVLSSQAHISRTTRYWSKPMVYCSDSRVGTGIGYSFFFRSSRVGIESNAKSLKRTRIESLV